MKRLTASVIGSLLGLVGWWCIEWRQNLEDWANDPNWRSSGGND